MREEIETKWIVNLLDNNGFGSKKEFETYATAPTDSTEFREWFKKLEELGVFTFSKSRKNSRGGKDTPLFKLNKTKLVKYLRNFDYYDKWRKVFHNLRRGDI